MVAKTGRPMVAIEEGSRIGAPHALMRPMLAPAGRGAFTLAWGLCARARAQGPPRKNAQDPQLAPIFQGGAQQPVLGGWQLTHAVGQQGRGRDAMALVVIQRHGHAQTLGPRQK